MTSPSEPGPTSTSSRPTLYDAVEVFGAERFDLVFTGIGALCWLPDIARWGQVVGRSAARRAAGSSSARGIRSLWSLADPRPDGLLVIEYARTSSNPSRRSGTKKAPTSAPTHQFDNTVSHDWSHGLAEVRDMRSWMPVWS